MSSEFEKKYRYIKRSSSDGRIKILEDINGSFVLTIDDEVIEIYEHLQHAYAAFGRETRKE